MSRTLITTLGLVVSFGIVALGVFLIALPVYLQSVAIDTQTATVASTNALYQAQVDTLREQEENLPEIIASVDLLRSQIPATAQLDDVFEVIARAAETSGASIQSVTAGEQVAFMAGTAGGGAAAATPADGSGTTDGAASDGTTEPDGATGDGAADPPVTPPVGGRQQVDFAIQVVAADMTQATAFLDALRSGPRLLSGIESSATQSGSGVDLQVSALTYLDSEG